MRTFINRIYCYCFTFILCVCIVFALASRPNPLHSDRDCSAMCLLSPKSINFIVQICLEDSPHVPALLECVLSKYAFVAFVCTQRTHAVTRSASEVIFTVSVIVCLSAFILISLLFIRYSPNLSFNELALHLCTFVDIYMYDSFKSISESKSKFLFFNFYNKKAISNFIFFRLLTRRRL